MNDRSMELRGRRRSSLALLYCGYLLGLLAAGCAMQPASAPATPSELYGELFHDVQTQGVFADSKTFVDAIPKRSPADVLADYRKRKDDPSFDLRAFVAQEFVVSIPVETAYRTRPGEDVRTHIDRLWKVLRREPVPEPPNSTRLPLPRPYIVPGGRFNEIYYWDSYFTMLGLKASGEVQLIRDMCDNFAHLIERYGHVPNGNRTYYLSRSQPPFFAAMVELLASIDGHETYARYRDALRREYEFWMEGAAALEPGETHRRVVRLADGTILNRYWDDRAVPREESYREDIATAQASGRNPQEVYRHLRAAAESGWDFSSRWFADGRTLSSIRTTDLVPVDLNSLLFQLELTLSRAFESSSAALSERYRNAARARQDAVRRYFWNERLGAFSDYDRQAGAPTEHLTAATAVPLFFGIASDEQARATAQTIRVQLLAPHGLRTTTVTTGEQWDAPNGWAPLQWMAIEGLNRYGERALAAEIAHRWIAQNIAVFQRTGKLVEKYDVVNADVGGGGGEYPLQDGFGWTNGVLRALLEKYPQTSIGSRMP
jgi:alpha,alpha-trehalase